MVFLGKIWSFFLRKVGLRHLLADVDSSEARHHSMPHKAEKCQWKSLLTHFYNEQPHHSISASFCIHLQNLRIYLFAKETRLGKYQRTLSACTERRLQEKRILFKNHKRDLRETRETWALKWSCQSPRLALWPECHLISVPYLARHSFKKQNKLLVWSYPRQVLPSGCSWTWSSSRCRI